MFKRWADRVAAAENEHDRRSLLAEIGRWRASHLTDIPALREAAFAMSTLYATLGDHDSAIREAKSLLSLCQTPPVASRDELRAAQGYLHSLGGSGIVGSGIVSGNTGRDRARDTSRDRPRDKARDKPRDAPARKDVESEVATDQIIAATQAGQFDDALRLLTGKKGPRTALLRSWVQLSKALAAEGDTQRDLLLDLQRRLQPREARQPREDKAPRESAPRAEKKVRAEAPATDDDHPLAALLGGRVPQKWQARLKAIESYLQDNPSDADQVAAHALDHHVTSQGPKSTAPWLISTVARALAQGAAERTRAALDRLAGSYAVTAYGEQPFDVLVSVLRLGLSTDWSGVDLRRGVSARGEPAERKLWTLRFTEGGVERLIVVGDAQDAPYPDGLVDKLAHRIVSLCPRAVLLAPGPGNEALRAAAADLGVAVADSAEPHDLLELARLAEAADVAPPPAPASPALDRLRDLLTAEQVDEAAIEALLAEMKRIHPAFAVAREATQGASDGVDRVLQFLRAAHRAAPERARLPEGTSLAARAAAAGSDAARAALTSGDTAARYGGPGIETVIDIVATLAGAGFVLDRILHGATARERRNDEVLMALDDSAEGLWRVVARSGDRKVEVAYLEALSPEGKAAAPRLLDRTDVVVLGDGLGEWFGSLALGQAVPWADGGAEGLARRLQG